MPHEVHCVHGLGRGHHVRLVCEVRVHVLGPSSIHVSGKVAGAAERGCALPIEQQANNSAVRGEDAPIEAVEGLNPRVECSATDGALAQVRRKDREEDALAVGVETDDLIERMEALGTVNV